MTGKKPDNLRWVNVNKGDDESPNVRCRIVAKDFNVDKRPDLFAATPPLEYLRYVVPRCASSQLGSEITKLMVQNVKKAYLCARHSRRVCRALAGASSAGNVRPSPQVPLRHPRRGLQLGAGIFRGL